MNSIIYTLSISGVQTGYVPEDGDVVYNSEQVDSHNAMDPGSGTFYAPFAGVYGFMFYARTGVNVVKPFHLQVKISWTVDDWQAYSA